MAPFSQELEPPRNPGRFKQHSGIILLDGHFTLLKPDGEIEAIEVDVFRELPLDAIVVYQDEPKKIAERLNNRDNSLSDPATIDKHQRLELNQARQVAAKLSVPIELLEAFDESGLMRLVSEWMAAEK